MSRKNRLTVADLAQEAGIPESKAIELLRKNGMQASTGFRISGSNLQRAREILRGGTEAANAREVQAKSARANKGAASGAHFRKTGMTLRDVVDAWLRKNPEPKHLVLKGVSFSDFIEKCYQQLLADTQKRGMSAEDIVTSEGRKHIETFLDRGKAAWYSRCQKEEAKADARRQAEARRKAEEKRAAEELDKAVIERQDEVRQKREEQRAAEVRRQQEALHMAHEDPHDKEEARAEEIFSKHQQAVVIEGNRLQTGECSQADYYAFVLRDRMARSAELLFGSAQQPSYELLQKNPELLDKLKRNLSFADDQHPGDYHDRYVSAYYTLRYELGYAFEYSQIYGMLLGIMQRKKEKTPLDVLSIGSGQGLDYWGLCYALSKQRDYRPRIGWHGVDLETWPDHILDDGLAQYSDGTDVCDLLSTMNRLDAKVLMFPKVIGELPFEVVDSIASWLQNVTFTRDVHYLCFAHTKRENFGPVDGEQKRNVYHFHGMTESSPAVKSAHIIRAACQSAYRQSYCLDVDWHNTGAAAMKIGYYDVVWPDAQNGTEWPAPYSFLVYDVAARGDWRVWRDDATFNMDYRLRKQIQGIGSSCCAKFIPAQNDHGDRSTDCAADKASCDNSYFCPLDRWPRFRTGGIAYQIVRLVKQPDDEDIPF